MTLVLLAPCSNQLVFLVWLFTCLRAAFFGLQLFLKTRVVALQKRRRRRRTDTMTVAIFTSFRLQAAPDSGTCSPMSSVCLPAQLCRDQHNVKQPTERAALLPEPSMDTKTSCCCSLLSPNKLRQINKMSHNTKESHHAIKAHI